MFERLWCFYNSDVGTFDKVIIQVYALKMKGTTGGLGLRLRYRLKDKLLQPSSFFNKKGGENIYMKLTPSLY
jgi:hypothetical protein